MSKPTRYFAGRAPTHTRDESSDDSETPSAPVPPAASSPSELPTRRRRLVARVVTSADGDGRTARVTLPVAGASGRRGSSAGFVSVRALREGRGGEGCAEEEGVESSGSSSEGSSESSSSEGSHHHGEGEGLIEEEEEEEPFLKPVFIKKDRRKREEEHVQTQEAQRKREERQLAERQSRREEAQRLVSEAINEEERRVEGWDGVGRDPRMPDDEDHEEDAEAEYALWKVRELRRIMQEREAEEARLAGVRPGVQYGHVEVAEEGAASAKVGVAEETLQKKYKVGPFFLEKGQDGKYSEELYNRDYGEVKSRRSEKMAPLSASELRGEADHGT